MDILGILFGYIHSTGIDWEAVYFCMCSGVKGEVQLEQKMDIISFEFLAPNDRSSS